MSLLRVFAVLASTGTTALEDLPGEFTCSDGSVIPSPYLCDGIQHCRTGEDEDDCYGWKCNNGVLLPTTSYCDGFPDCPNMEDETSCGESELHWNCLDSSTIPQSSHCDNIRDCRNGEDEIDCAPSETYKCSDGSVIASQWICDGIWHCRYGEDEAECDVCTEPNVPNGSANCEGFTAGDMCEISCDRGFRLNGGPLTCLQNGEWDLTPECVERSVCRQPNVQNGTANCEGFQAGDVCQISCSPSFRPNTGPLTCLENGEWDRTSKCERLGCTGGAACCSPSEPCGHGEGDCDADEDCLGGLTCGANNCGQFDYGVFGDGFDAIDDCCVANRCPPFRDIEFSSVLECDAHRVGEYCYFECESGYKRSGEFPRCQEDQTWSRPHPSCVHAEAETIKELICLDESTITFPYDVYCSYMVCMGLHDPNCTEYTHLDNIKKPAGAFGPSSDQTNTQTDGFGISSNANNDDFGVPSNTNGDGFGVSSATNNDGFGMPSNTNSDDFGIASDSNDGFGMPSNANNDGFGIASGSNDGFGMSSNTNNDGFQIASDPNKVDFGNTFDTANTDNDAFGKFSDDTNVNSGTSFENSNPSNFGFGLRCVIAGVGFGVAFTLVAVNVAKRRRGFTRIRTVYVV